MNRAVVVVDYDPRWPAAYEFLRAPITAALGELAAAIEHVGSTAVAGMAAKPVIDIDVLLRCGEDLPEARRRLAVLGYEHQGDRGIAGREAFRIQPNDPAHHLYVCLPQSPEFGRHVAFRDYLRAHSDEARAYGRLKKSLARQVSDMAAYMAGKDEFIRDRLRRAMESIEASR